MSEVKIRLCLDILNWIGRNYKTTAKFISEARRLGCCRRVPNVPEDIIVGKSRVFLANKEGVFAYYVVQGLAYITKKGLNLPQELLERGVEPVTVTEAAGVPERGCGYLQVGGLYLLSEEDMEKVTDLASSSELEGCITLVQPPVPYDGGSFRGYKYVRGAFILERRPEHTWWISDAYRRTARSLVADKLKEQNKL